MINNRKNGIAGLSGIIFIIFYFFIGYSYVLAKIEVTYLGSVDKNYFVVIPAEKVKPVQLLPPRPVVSKLRCIIPEYVKFLEEESDIKVTYIGITSEETYPAEEKSPEIITILDPYHKGFKIPYYKDREGLKIHPFIGVASKYEYKTQFMWGTTALEAKQFGNISKADLKKYTSLDKKSFWRTRLSLNFGETLPKFIYTYHSEDVRVEYAGKLEWANNKVWHEEIKYHDFNLEHTIPGLKYIGFLRINLGYRMTEFDSDYIEKFKGDSDRYHIALTFMPWNIGKLKLEYNYTDEDKDDPPNIYGVAMSGLKEHEYIAELTLDFPRQRLKIIPSYKFKHEKWKLAGGLNETWEVHEASLKLEKIISDKWEFHSDLEWGYISRERPVTEIPRTIKARGWDIENNLHYELWDDFDLILDFGYMDMLDLDYFTAYHIGPRIRYYKPGLIDFGLGYAYVDFYEIGDEEHFLFFRLSLFM